VPTPPTGVTTLKPIDLHGALFMIQQIRKYPNEVTLYVGGPFTTVALALGLDPEIATLAKELVLMGAGFNVDQGGNHRINGRREFNWWWDPEATRIGMSAPWKKITITPVDISVKTTLSDDLKRRLATSKSLAAQFITKFMPPGQEGAADSCGTRSPCWRSSIEHHHQAAGALRQHRHRSRRRSAVRPSSSKP
jgi:inosine-uridine nucleoside N-ribohydrolase